MSDAAIWWLRSPNTNNNNNVWNVNTDGSNNNNWYNNSYGVVVVGVAVAVDITEVGSVARIRRTLPPVVRRQGNNAGLDPVIQEDFYIGRDLSA